MLEDALLMIAYSIVRNPQIRTLASSFTDMKRAQRRELHDMFTGEQREQFHHPSSPTNKLIHPCVSTPRPACRSRSFAAKR